MANVCLVVVIQNPAAEETQMVRVMRRAQLPSVPRVGERVAISDDDYLEVTDVVYYPCTKGVLCYMVHQVRDWDEADGVLAELAADGYINMEMSFGG